MSQSAEQPNHNTLSPEAREMFFLGASLGASTMLQIAERYLHEHGKFAYLLAQLRQQERWFFLRCEGRERTSADTASDRPAEPVKTLRVKRTINLTPEERERRRQHGRWLAEMQRKKREQTV